MSGILKFSVILLNINFKKKDE